jgi:hypothetical protein
MAKVIGRARIAMIQFVDVNGLAHTTALSNVAFTKRVQGNNEDKYCIAKYVTGTCLSVNISEEEYASIMVELSLN